MYEDSRLLRPCMSWLVSRYLWRRFTMEAITSKHACPRFTKDKKKSFLLVNIITSVAFRFYLVQAFIIPICPAMTGGRTTSNTNLSSRRWRNRTIGSSWDEFSAAMLDLSSVSRLFSMIRMSPILTGNMCSSRACTNAKNLSRYWS